MSTIDAELRAQAVESLSKAWADAENQGVPADVLAGIALAKSYSELVSIMGQNTAANIAARFVDEIRSGKFGGD